MDTNKVAVPTDNLLGRLRRCAQQWHRRHGRAVYEKVLHGAATGIGSGAVSLVTLWVQSRFF
ncbi:hypothetical protein QIS99_31180 [Streptomyces sp. B-S-A8]|uniref:Uncharacterized protein n=1 Tax=Streptomyces solicavernae TaxID=3043614 RepID=A0ABT6S1R4_9ACTN|nr:hypothetical protein [Streptomyces sp. B-S-A8]MDI3390625.1 hypothetical protein [Streptomyces sp. B-S-A8]